MRARDLAVGYKTVSVGSAAVEAARLLAEHKLPGLLVLDEDGEPQTILPASQMIKVLVPTYVLEDPTLAPFVDEKHADRLCQALAGRRVGDVLSSEATKPPTADDTALEVAVLMAQVCSPLVAVTVKAEDGTHLLGVITASHLLHELLGRTVATSNGWARPRRARPRGHSIGHSLGGIRSRPRGTGLRCGVIRTRQPW